MVAEAIPVGAPVETVRDVNVVMSDCFNVNGIRVEVWGSYAKFCCQRSRVTEVCAGIEQHTKQRVCAPTALLQDNYLEQQYHVSLYPIEMRAPLRWFQGRAGRR